MTNKLLITEIRRTSQYCSRVDFDFQIFLAGSELSHIERKIYFASWFVSKLETVEILKNRRKAGSVVRRGKTVKEKDEISTDGGAGIVWHLKY